MSRRVNMYLVLRVFVILFYVFNCSCSYKEQYRVPFAFSDRWESYIFNEKEYIVQNLPVTWENAKILCRGHYNGTLAVLDTRDKAEFLAEVLSELQFSIESVWVGARRDSGEDPEGYRWGQGLELRRTAADVLPSEDQDTTGKPYPVWLNRTHIPVPDGGADCVGFERVRHDKPVFVDLPCNLERPFACEREARVEVRVTEMKSVRCRTGLYRIFDGRLDWHQAAAYCVINKMALANIATAKCLRKLGLSMLKSRPSIESAWVGAKGALGQWNWVDTGLSIFVQPPVKAAQGELWPPMRDRQVKQNGCLQVDRHAARAPVFLEARCERKMQFICYQGASGLRFGAATPSDDSYYYVLVRQLLFWQHAAENCHKMNGSLANVDGADILTQLLLAMGENKDEPVEHIWVSGRLNVTKDVATDAISYVWVNPNTGKRILDPKNNGDQSTGLYMPPWLDGDFTMDSPCMNLDRQDHLSGLIYGLPCDTPQYSVCMIEKSSKSRPAENLTEGYETA